MPVKCIMIVSPPAGGGTLVGKTLMAMGFKAPGTPGDPTLDWDLVCVNQIMCDRVTKPKIGLGMTKYALEHMEEYVKNKISEGKDWLMHDPMLCMTFFEFASVLKKHEVDYKIIMVMRMPHHNALEIIRGDKTWTLEEAAAVLGRYIVARSLNTERLYLDDKQSKETTMHLDFNQLLDNPDECSEQLASLAGVELTDAIKEELNKLLKPAS